MQWMAIYPLDRFFGALRNWGEQISYCKFYKIVRITLTYIILQSINQSINHAVNQPINQSINQPINQSINQSVSQSIYHSIYPSINPLFGNGGYGTYSYNISGAPGPHTHRKEKETHALFSWLPWLAVLLVGTYARPRQRRRRSRTRWRP